MAEQTFRTLMRTTDILVTARLSPAAIVAVGLADLYAQLPLRFGLGLGAGTIALTSQDTGGDAAANRDEAVTQAVLLGLLLGVPLALTGLLFGEELIALLGASPEVARLGGAYLAIIFTTAGARHVALIGGRSLQGTGDTRTPMYVNAAANVVNVAGTVVLGLGWFGAPKLGVVGIGLATAVTNVLTAGLLLAAIHRPKSDLGFVRPRSAVVAKQLVVISVPRIAEGLAEAVARFPFNALLLTFGTPVNAGYQVGRRLYQQVTAPLSRGYGVAASVLVGQALGDERPEAARFEGWAVAALGVVTVGLIGAGVLVAADELARLFTRDPATVTYSVGFARAYGLAAPGLVAFIALSGALQGAGETRVPFVARLTGTFGFMLGVSYALGVTLGYGAVGAYVGLALTYTWMAAVVAWSFRSGNWAGRAADMMDERRSAGE